MDVTLEFLGAADTVTGSATLIRGAGKRILVDCGLFQGQKELRQRNWQGFPVDPSSLDVVILTHAHLDHSGYLPRLVKEGYRGPIYVSPGTLDLCGILLPDAAHLEMEQARYANTTRYSHHYPALPLFTDKDAELALKHMQAHPRHQWKDLGGGISFRYLNAGHIIGSSMVEFAIAAGHKTHILTFTGDLGHQRSCLLRGPEALIQSDTLVLESTYGNRLHARSDVKAALAKVVERTLDRSGVLLIPAFAVGRTQEILFLLKQLQDEGRIPLAPVVLDSPMAIRATEVCLRHTEDHILDSQFLGGSGGIHPATFEAVTSSDESMLYCMKDGPLIVISAAGMLTGGRILHHLKARLPYAQNTVLFTGYQAEGSKGRFLQESAGTATALRIFHEEVPVNCEIVTLDNLSAHGDYQDILDWLSTMKVPPQHILLNHGDPGSQQELAKKIAAHVGCKVSTASQQTRFNLLKLAHKECAI